MLHFTMAKHNSKLGKRRFFILVMLQRVDCMVQHSCEARNEFRYRHIFYGQTKIKASATAATIGKMVRHVKQCKKALPYLITPSMTS